MSVESVVIIEMFPVGMTDSKTLRESLQVTLQVRMQAH